MLPRETVPASTRGIVHKTPLRDDGAIDIYAPRGSEVLAPGDGRVADAMPSPAVPGSWQIRGRIMRRDGKEVPFVCAHFTEGSVMRGGDTFKKGEVLGVIQYWAAHPRSTHIHWSFRRVGDTLPPPGNVSVIRAFERFGRMPGGSP
jgi:Peptidase family M23